MNQHIVVPVPSTYTVLPPCRPLRPVRMLPVIYCPFVLHTNAPCQAAVLYFPDALQVCQARICPLVLQASQAGNGFCPVFLQVSREYCYCPACQRGQRSGSHLLSYRSVRRLACPSCCPDRPFRLVTGFYRVDLHVCWEAYMP